MKKVIRLLICIAMTIILTVGCEYKDIDNTNFNNENQSVNYDIDVTSNNLTNENKVERSTVFHQLKENAMYGYWM